MEFEVATYSYSALAECADLVKSTKWSVNKGIEHTSKCFEVKRVFEFCEEKTGCCLFEPDFSPWADYMKLVNIKASKKKLDAVLRTCYRFVCNELNGIVSMMKTGEVNAVD
jgi:hypothetical protein